MKNVVLAVALAVSGVVVGQAKETIHFSSIDELIAYNKYTDSLKSNFNAEDHIDSIFIILNEYRISQGVKPVVLDKNLNRVANLQASYNATHGIVTHDNVDSLNTIHKRAYQFNESHIAAEVATVSGFTDSRLTNRSVPMLPMYNLQYCTAHAFIIKQPEYTRCGVSLVQSISDSNKFYTVIVFATK